jgi:CubicO group peptidase (beta-lactamase class C family)
MQPSPDRPSLPPQSADTAWPTQAWPLGELPAGADRAKIGAMLDHAFAAAPPADLGRTDAVVVIHRGRLVAERYGPEFGPDVTCWSWSMAKSITQALVGMAVKDGLIDIHVPADVPEWSAPGDPRGAITLDQLLRMSSGLSFVEVYEEGQVSDVREMLFGAGENDVAGFAAGFPPAHAPGSFWSYSSGATNIISRCFGRALGRSGPSLEAWMRERLFEPLGMTSVLPRFDAAGTFIGSSYCFATPRDFARFGLLYLRDGMWDGERLLPEGWVDYARTPTFQQAEAADSDAYGAHWWIGLAGPGSFSANGYDGQYIVICPDRDLIVVRNGASEAVKTNVKAWLADLAAAFVSPATP